MITKKELNYVDTWANRVPYPGTNYCEEALDKLTENLKLYNEMYSKIIFNISFSNNEEIEFKILEKNICHMLGIDSRNLTSQYFYDFRKTILDLDPDKTISSYELINAVTRNIDKIIEYDKSHTGRALNYYKISIKCDIFNKLSNLTSFNFGCINFSKDTYLNNKPESKFNSNSTKFLYTLSDEIVSPYFMMGLINENAHKNTNVDDDDLVINNGEINTYIVETLIAPEDINGMFKNQEVIIPTQILTDVNGTLERHEADPSSKIRLLKDYQALICQYGIDNRINIYSDYLSYLLKEQRKNDSLSRSLRK
jgi:hypothetical protein